MGYKIIKIKKTIYEINSIKLDFIDVETFIRVRSKMNNKMYRCFFCENKLEDLPYEDISIALLYNNKNQVLCRACALEVSKNPEVKVI